MTASISCSDNTLHYGRTSTSNIFVVLISTEILKQLATEFKSFFSYKRHNNLLYVRKIIINKGDKYSIRTLQLVP